ncbi:MAG: hypothetical protein PVH91_05300 [Pseudomonadales bacterium]|jgi:hypothetical protein
MSEGPAPEGWVEPSSTAYYQQPPPGPELPADSLHEILSSLDLPVAEVTLSPWDRFLRWLDDLLGGERRLGVPDWVDDFHLAPETVTWIFYGACAVVVVLSLAIVANEIRLARAGPGDGASGRRHGGQEHSDDEARPTGAADLTGRVLRALVSALGLAQGRRADSLTHAEIRTACSTIAPEQAEPVRRMADVAERLRYAASPPVDDEVLAAVAASRTLLDRLGRSA